MVPSPELPLFFYLPPVVPTTLPPAQLFLSDDRSSASALAPTWPQALLVLGSRRWQGCLMCRRLPPSTSPHLLRGRTPSSFCQTYHEITLSSPLSHMELLSPLLSRQPLLGTQHECGASDHLPPFSERSITCVALC